MDIGLRNLLDLHGTEVHREDNYWWKIEVWRTVATRERPHGIRYNLTLHNKFNNRIFGMDNAHAVKIPKKKGYGAKRHDYDHILKSASDKGTPYEFTDCATLLNNFFIGVDKTIESIKGQSS